MVIHATSRAFESTGERMTDSEYCWCLRKQESFEQNSARMVSAFEDPNHPVRVDSRVKVK